MASDEQLIERAAAGDEQALMALLERYGPLVRRKLDGKIDRRWQSLLSEDDVMQETYADAFLSIARFEFRGERSFERWLTTLAQNNLRDAIKGLKTAKSGGGRVQPASQAGEDSRLRLFEVLAGSSTSPSQRAARNEMAELLNRTTDQLPEAYRQVVRLYDLDGHSAQDVATQLGCSEGAVYMRRARAHALLKELLGDQLRL